MRIKLQNPDTGETFVFELTLEDRIAMLAEMLSQSLSTADGIIFYTYFKREVTEKYSKKTIVEGDCVYLPDDITIREVIDSLRHPDLPIYFRHSSIEPRLVFKYRTDRFSRIGYDVALLQGKTVMIGGIGVLGSEIAYNLVVLGLGRLVLVDNGSVDWSNIYRQPLFKREDVYSKKVDAAAEELKKMSGIEVTPLAFEVPCLTSTPSLEWFHQQIKHLVTVGKESDLIVGAFDIFSARGVLQIIARYLQKPFLSAALDPWTAESVLFEPGENHCYCCGKRLGEFLDGGACTLAKLDVQKTISAVASRQIIEKLQDQQTDCNSWTIDSQTLTIRQTKQAGTPDCSVCGANSTLSSEMTTREISGWVFNWMFPKFEKNS